MSKKVNMILTIITWVISIVALVVAIIVNIQVNNYFHPVAKEPVPSSSPGHNLYSEDYHDVRNIESNIWMKDGTWIRPDEAELKFTYTDKEGKAQNMTVYWDYDKSDYRLEKITDPTIDKSYIIILVEDDDFAIFVIGLTEDLYNEVIASMQPKEGLK